jgi:glycosyltransferase involved in cell wall biosynthesis
LPRPAVTVLIPSYNHARFLSAAIESLLAQTLDDWALIVADDGSEDASAWMAAEFAAKDPRIQAFVNERNLGTYGTLQRALERADGEFVAVLNSDDRWAPTKLERQIEHLEDHPELPICYTLGWKTDYLDNVDKSDDVQGDWPRTPVQELLPNLLYQNRILASSVLFRRKDAAFDNSLRYSGDWVALLRPARASAFGCIPERLTFWRMHGANSYVRSVHQVTEEVRVRSAILERPSRWFVSRLPARDIRNGLGMNALALAALELLRGRRRSALGAALTALKYLPAKRPALRRLGACLLPDGRERLWPGDTTQFDRPGAPLPLSFL